MEGIKDERKCPGGRADPDGLDGHPDGGSPCCMHPAVKRGVQNP